MSFCRNWKLDSRIFKGGTVSIEARPYELDMDSEPHVELRVHTESGAAGVVLDEGDSLALIRAMLDMYRVPKIVQRIALASARGMPD